MSTSKPSDILIHAELSWRIGHCFRFWGSYFADDFKSIRLRNDLLELTEIFWSKDLPCHPLACGHGQSLSLARRIEDIAGPSLRYQINKYMNFNKGNLNLSKQASLALPFSTMHRYEYLSNRNGGEQYITYRGPIEQEIPFAHPAVFSPVMEMAIGHYAVIAEYLYVQRIYASSEPVYFVRTKYGIECGVLSHLEQEFANFECMTVDNPVDLVKTANHLSDYMLDCDYRMYWLPQSVQTSIRQMLFLSNTSNKKRKIVLHTRTSAYKNDEANVGNNMRSVDPASYSKLVEALSIRHYDVYHISACKDDLIVSGAISVMIENEDDKSRQWQLLQNSDFIIGTSSGISHFACLTQFRALLTNYTSMPSDYFYADGQVVSLKRFRIKKGINNIDAQLFASLLISHWGRGLEREISLQDIADISDLSEDDLVENALEFIDYLSGKTNVHTFHELFAGALPAAKMSFLPNWLVSSTTASDIHAFLRDLANDGLTFS